MSVARLWTGLTGLLVLCCLLPGGCPTAPTPMVPSDDVPTATLTLGTFDTTLSPTDLNVFQVLAPAELALDITVTPVAESVLGIGFAEAPDGTTVFSTPGASAVSADASIAVTPQSSDFGTGLRLFGTSSETGVWRFSLEADPSGAQSAVDEQLAGLSFVGQFGVFLWNLGGQPSSGPLFDFVTDQVPALAQLNERIPAIIAVTLSDPSNPDPGGGGDSDITPAPSSISLEEIVRTGDPVPGQSGATFSYFGNPLIDDEERVAFFASYTGGTGSNGLYVFADGTLQRIFDDSPGGTAVPGGAMGDSFGGFDVSWDGGAPSLAWGPDGRLIFVAHINDSGLPNAVFRWRAVDGDLLELALPSTFQALFSNASDDFLPEFYFPGLSDTGIVHFVSRYSFFDSGGAFVFFDNGLFQTNGVRLSAIVDEQITPTAAVPGQNGATFNGFELVSAHNTSGDILLQGNYLNGNGTHGVYRWDGTTLTRVVDNGGSPLPGLSAGITLGATGQPFSSVAIGDRGELAINAPLTIGGVTNDEVVYFNGTDWTRLTSSEGRRAGFLMSGINRRGQVVFRASGDPHIGDEMTSTRISDALPGRLVAAGVSWPGFGAALNNQNRCVVRFERASGGVGLLFWNGSNLLDVADLELGQPLAWDTIFSPDQPVLDEDLVRRSTVKDRPELDRPGRTGMLSDDDVLVFRIGSTGADGTEDTGDDEQAIYVGRGQ